LKLNPIIKKKIFNGTKFRSIISAYDFNINIELSANKKKDKRKERFEQRLGVRFATHEKNPSAPSKIVYNSEKITGTGM
jgi:small nuclear ribonucleoprotein (snRNP)-like protein